MKKIESAIKSSEEDFVLVAGMMCHSCLTNIDVFSAHKVKYTPLFVQDLLDNCNNAAFMPNQQQRQSTSVALRAVLAASGSVSCINFITLASYIESSFPADKVESMKKMAGGAYLTEARKCNWSSVSTMNNMTLTFIGTYSSELVSGGMTEDFPDTCTTGSQAFSDALGAYNSYKQTAEQQVQERTTAFNNVYARLKGIMNDGKVIFQDDATMRKQFTYNAVLKKVANNTRSGFRIAVIDGVTELPVTKATIQFVQGEWSFSANDKGIIYAKMPQGNYNGTVTAPGYSPVVVKLTSSKGVVHREEVTLTAVAEKVFAD